MDTAVSVLGDVCVKVDGQELDVMKVCSIYLLVYVVFVIMKTILQPSAILHVRMVGCAQDQTTALVLLGGRVTIVRKVFTTALVYYIQR